jgi:hypothetical protein
MRPAYRVTYQTKGNFIVSSDPFGAGWCCSVLRRWRRPKLLKPNGQQKSQSQSDQKWCSGLVERNRQTAWGTGVMCVSGLQQARHGLRQHSRPWAHQGVSLALVVPVGSGAATGVEVSRSMFCRSRVKGEPRSLSARVQRVRSRQV